MNEPTQSDSPKGRYRNTLPSSEDFVAEKGYEVWLENDRPEEWRCAQCEARTGFDSVGHPPGRHLPQTSAA